MREILFRGKRLDNGEWVYGSYYLDLNGNDYIVPINWTLVCDSEIKVLHETVGQFTGLLDKNFNKIFEGDIVTFYEVLGQMGLEIPKKGFVSYQNGAYIIRYKENQKDRTWQLSGAWHIEIIGNIHDNGELYKKIKGEIK